jgi:pterin-4a-carbinolamine dehydratase
MGHHPDILIHNGGSVRITSTTHDLGGITEKDIALVESLEILVNT